jgi:tetratricopeptide (TPR) repeat protein
LGAAFYQQGRIAEAIQHFHEALRLKPDYSDARRTASGKNYTLEYKDGLDNQA